MKRIKIAKNDSVQKIQAFTHPAPHHADEVFATVMLSYLIPGDMILCRTRDSSILNHVKNAFVYDVGGTYDPAHYRFDHHQAGFDQKRESGIKYSSAGLIWRQYADRLIPAILGEADNPEILEGAGDPAFLEKTDDPAILEETSDSNQKKADFAQKGSYQKDPTRKEVLYHTDGKKTLRKIADRVDQILIEGIDAHDNGQIKGSESCMSISTALSLYNPTWEEEQEPDSAFLASCALADAVLIRAVQNAVSYVHGVEIIEAAIAHSDGKILLLPRFIGGWTEIVLSSDAPKAAGLLYGIFPALDGNWNIRALPPSLAEPMAQRKPFPKEWRGLSGEALIETSGISSAVFCHAAGFFAVAKTREDAIRLAEKACEIS